MTDESDQPAHRPDETIVSRRGALMLGALGASAVVTIRPALANTAGSVLNCEIPIPDAGHDGKWIASDGSLVDPDTPGSFRPPLRPVSGEDAKAALRGRSLPGTDWDQSKAYTNYIRRLQRGMSGFTCYASLQMPRS